MQTTDSQDEIFPIVNARDEVVGKISRAEAHKNPNIIHRASIIFVYNEKNELLIQKRSKTKDVFPDCWDVSAGGHVEYGDDYLSTAVRELSEELGIVVLPEQLELKGKILLRVAWESEFWQVYKLTIPKDTKLILKKDEVSNIKFISHGVLLVMLADKSVKRSTKFEEVFRKFFL